MRPRRQDQRDMEIQRRTGQGHWNNGGDARIVIERFDEGGINIRRIDMPQHTYGQTAV